MIGSNDRSLSGEGRRLGNRNLPQVSDFPSVKKEKMRRFAPVRTLDEEKGRGVKIALATLLVVFICRGIVAAQAVDRQAPNASNTTSNEEPDLATLRNTINNGWACIQMPGDEVDGVLRKMPPEKAATAKVTYNDATGFYEILYQYDDPWSIDYYGKNCCLPTEEGQRNINAFLARRDAADKAQAAHMKKALADLQPYITGEKSKKSVQPYICGGARSGEIWGANGKDLGHQAIYVSVADPKNVWLVRNLLPSSIDGIKVIASYVPFGPDTVLPFSDGPCSGGAPCEDKCEFPCDNRCFRYCPSSCKSD
jgi:hypothetical protein